MTGPNSSRSANLYLVSSQDTLSTPGGTPEEIAAAREALEQSRLWRTKLALNPNAPIVWSLGSWQITIAPADDGSGPPRRSMSRFWIVALISMLIHITIVLLLPKRELVMGDPPANPLGMQVELAPSPSPPINATPAPARPSPVPQRQILAVPNRPSTVMPPVPIIPPAPEVPTRDARPVPPEQDFMAQLEARRAARAAQEAAFARENALARGGPGDPNGDEKAKAAIARNVQTLSQRRDGTSGVFEIIDKGHRTATFGFRGWTVSRENSWKEVIEVDAGLGGNIERAIVKRMIVLIRTHYKGDFNWDSHKLGRVVPLSARPEHNAELEEFMMREFFGDPVRR
jgi:hypothetical protein